MKSLILKEYDQIISDEKLTKDNPTNPNANGTYSLCSEYFDALKNVLLKREEQDKDKETLRGSVVRFVKLRNHIHNGEILQIQHYVGIVRISKNFQVEVLPKIEVESFNRDEEARKLEKILLRMLGYLKDFPATPSDTADLDTSRTSLYEVFIELYLDKVKCLIQHGLRYHYVTIEENSTSFKGSLDVMKQLRYNIAQKQRFYVSHDEYLLDSPENRLIKSTLIYLSDKSESGANSKKARNLLETLEMVPESEDYIGDYKKISYDRFNDFYHDVIEWSMAFLLGKSFIISKGTTEADSLLFPMEKIFECFIARKLAQCLRKSEFRDKWKIKAQSTKKFLFDDPKKFEIRPDIRIYSGKGYDEKNIIFDTKWKKLQPGEVRNNGISSADMYQMYAYAKRYRANDVYLMYPYSKEEDRIEIKQYKTEYDPKVDSIKLDSNVTVHIFFMNLSGLCDKEKKAGMKKIEDQLNGILTKSIEFTGKPGQEVS